MYDSDTRPSYGRRWREVMQEMCSVRDPNEIWSGQLTIVNTSPPPLRWWRSRQHALMIREALSWHPKITYEMIKSPGKIELLVHGPAWDVRAFYRWLEQTAETK